MQRQALILGLVFTFLVVDTATLLAEPMSTALEKVIQSSPTIVIATLLEETDTKNHTAKLEVLQVLRGDLKPGTHTVNYGYSTSRVKTKSGEVVVFLDEKLSWQFIAVPLHGRTEVAGSVLGLSGFYNFNAHIVHPGLLTLDLLKGYLKDGSLVYRFRGPIYFPEVGKSEWLQSSLNITGTYDAIKKEANVAGLPSLEAYPEQPNVGVLYGFHGPGKINLTYTRALNRELQLMGLVDRVDPKTGELHVRYAVEKPEILSEIAFREYLSDKAKYGFWSSFKFPCVKQGDAAERVLFLEVGKPKGGRWESMQLVGWEKEPIEILAMTYSDPDNKNSIGMYTEELKNFPNAVRAEFVKQDSIMRLLAKSTAGEAVVIVLEFEEGGVPSGPFVWTFQDRIPNLLYTRKTRGTVLVTEGNALKTVGTFTPVFESMGFNENK
jgi:hypothetical protein